MNAGGKIAHGCYNRESGQGTFFFQSLQNSFQVSAAVGKATQGLALSDKHQSLIF